MSIDVGFYFGGSSMSIAYSRDEKLSIIVNEAGYRTTPSVLSLTDNEYLVGVPAKHNIIRNSKNTVLFAKHFIDKSQSTAQKELLQKLDCQLKDKSENETSFILEDKEISLGEVIEREIKYIFELAKTSLSTKTCNAVLSYPCYFTKEQAEFLGKCAQKVGFNVLRMMKNPIAACLAYDLEDDNSLDTNVLVYRMGGNSLEISIVNITNGLMRILDSLSLFNVGGDMFTSSVVDILCEEFQRKHKSNPKENKRSMFKLKSNAEELKMILSTMERAHCSIDALYDGLDFDFYLTRQRFESACTKLYEQILMPIDDLLKKNSMTETEIDKVILCGASTKMVKLQQLIRHKFGEPKLVNYQSPDEVVALGCAKQASIIMNSKYNKKEANQQDSFFKCLSKPLYYRTGNSEDKIVLLKENVPLPIRRSINLDFDPAQPILTLLEHDKDLVKINLKDFKTREVSMIVQIKMNETIEINLTESATNERISVFLNSETSIEP